jgi:hypothetical protein
MDEPDCVVTVYPGDGLSWRVSALEVAWAVTLWKPLAVYV